MLSDDLQLDAASSATLLARAKAGDPTALDLLLLRYLPRLRRWAHGRLPPSARGLTDTDDVIQDTVVKTLRNLHCFEPAHEGALQAYLRTALMNQLRDRVRSERRRPRAVELGDRAGDDRPAVERLIGREAVLRYERALARLPARDREAIIGRFELGYSFRDLAVQMGSPNAEAMRKTVERAVARLASEMARG